jgi:acylphosphatase
VATAVRIRVTGIVHGVSFRATMAQMATDVGVRGWVRNLPDGSVEAFLEGDEKNVRRVVEWSRTGPPHARVDRVVVQSASSRNYRDFRIHG